MNLGEQIKTRRSELNMTQEELAEKLSVTRSAVSNWETEKNYPDLQTIVNISEELNISLDILLKGDRKVVEKITKDTNENPKLRSKIKVLFAVVIVLCIIGIALVYTNQYMNRQSYMPYSELNLRVTDSGDMYVGNPFYCWYSFEGGENNEIGLVFFTKSNGKDTVTKEIVGTFNKNGNNKQAVYYIPEKYIKKYNMLESKLIETFPTEDELIDIMTEDNLVWRK
ncbi:MAG: helix-turn-helix transcriptional regulator [Clostridiales bacterium]|nr:helix-turn-helix transcriptional regulator [Candidatus Crickella equi]